MSFRSKDAVRAVDNTAAAALVDRFWVRLLLKGMVMMVHAEGWGLLYLLLLFAF